MLARSHWHHMMVLQVKHNGTTFPTKLWISLKECSSVFDQDNIKKNIAFGRHFVQGDCQSKENVNYHSRKIAKLTYLCLTLRCDVDTKIFLSNTTWYQGNTTTTRLKCGSAKTTNSDGKQCLEAFSCHSQMNTNFIPVKGQTLKPKLDCLIHNEGKTHLILPNWSQFCTCTLFT